MCGIVSIFNMEVAYNKDIHDMLSQLIAVNTVRGADSTGLFFGTDYWAETHKKAVPGFDFVDQAPTQRILRNYEKYDFLVAHNRAATKGFVNAANAHPFQHEHITGVHNGTLMGGYQQLTKAFDQFDTDSEYIFKALSEKEPEDIIPELNGAFCLVWHDSRDNTLHLIRNDERPYAMAKIKDKNILVGASEGKMLQWVAKRNRIELEPVCVPAAMTEHIYTFDPTSDEFFTTKKHEEYSYLPPARSHRGNNWTHQNGNKGTGTGGADSGTTITNTRYEFRMNHWQPYNNQGTMGQWFGETEDGDKVIVYQASANDLEANMWYEGWSRSRKNSQRIAIDIATIKEWEPAALVDASGHPIVYECTECESEVEFEMVTFLNNQAICNECIATVDTEEK